MSQARGEGFPGKFTGHMPHEGEEIWSTDELCLGRGSTVIRRRSPCSPPSGLQISHRVTAQFTFPDFFPSSCLGRDLVFPCHGRTPLYDVTLALFPSAMWISTVTVFLVLFKPLLPARFPLLRGCAPRLVLPVTARPASGGRANPQGWCTLTRLGCEVGTFLGL